MKLKLVRFPISGGYKIMVAGFPAKDSVDFRVEQYRDEEWVVRAYTPVGTGCVGHSPNKATAQDILERFLTELEEEVLPQAADLIRAVHAARYN